MSKLNSILPGGCCPRPSPIQIKPLPMPKPLPGKPLPGPKPLPFPGPKPLPHPLPGKPDLFTPARSAQLARSQAAELANIQRGLADGSLSQREAASLLERQAKISDRTAQAQADGVITREEQLAINRHQLEAGAYRTKFSRNTERGEPGASRGQAAQLGSIANGIRNGQLTGNEAASLLRGQSSIATATAQAQSDGKVTTQESIHLALQRMQASAALQRELKDAEKAPHSRTNHFPILYR